MQSGDLSCRERVRNSWIVVVVDWLLVSCYILWDSLDRISLSKALIESHYPINL